MGTYCSYLWRRVYINRSGEVFACCHQKPVPYGNIHDAPLKELVNSPPALRLRMESLTGGLSCYPACNLLDKAVSTAEGHERSRIDYDSLRFLHISFGEACNIRCVMCDNPQRHRENPILLDSKLVIQNVDLAPFSDIMLRGGEPLYVQPCLDFIDHLERIGKRYSLLTNGILIDGERAQRLAEHAHSVIVSLNGATKEAHESVNKGSRFERVIRNIQRLRQARDEVGSTLAIVGHMTITTSNLTEIPRFLRTFKRLGFDRVNFGFVKETVPLFLATHPALAAALAVDTSHALESVGGPEVDAFRLSFLGLWKPTIVGDPSKLRTAAQVYGFAPTSKGEAERVSVSESVGHWITGDLVLQSLGTLGHDERAIVFLRHSEREKRLSASAGDLDHIPLTERGHQLARRFGRKLPPLANLSVSHSSIIRSIQTAAEIDDGYRAINPEIPSALRGKDSSFSVIYRGTVDKRARDAFRASLRGQAFTQMWLDGQVPLSIMKPARPTLDDFIRELLVRLSRASPASLHVHVGHDREIELVRTAVFGGRLSDFPMMDFLDGLIFRYREHSEIRVQWHDRAVNLANIMHLKPEGELGTRTAPLAI